ncbi:GNAT family acetyltransferase [Natronomonas moolapensis 8.8.11]|uniref:GNAT family acetyltransferase n=1 Tax=Natronomonas moolapensis (strain DSM 18674 / CECT 7526 / JCM 14361 / 8.8.11) TaxID=268739 RepID=M1Y287_NATM8|nr:GNAT family acetyltransferase [Natronomonas moolapensis 8.8.11]
MVADAPDDLGPDPDRNFTPPGDVTISSAGTDDADRLADLWVDLAADQRRHSSHLEAEANREVIHETMLRHAVTDTVFSARRGGTVVGFVTFGVESGRYEQDVTRGTIHNVYVEPSDRGEGIGSALLAAAERELVSLGVGVVTLEAMARNDAARSFYARHGYTPHRIELEKPINDDPLSNDG